MVNMTETIRLDGDWHADHTDQGPAWRTFHGGWAGGVDGESCGQFCMLATVHPGPHMLNMPALHAHLHDHPPRPGRGGRDDHPSTGRNEQQ